MAKVSLTKLGLKVNQEIKTIKFNEQIIEVKQYLSVNDKLDIISNIINLSVDDNNYANPVKVNIYMTLEILYAYTNVNFTEKQKEDPTKLYDILVSSGFTAEVIHAIPESEYNELLTGIMSSIEAIYNYRNSVMGILDIIGQDYNNLDLDITALQEKLADPNSLELLKNVLSKLG